MFYTYQADRTEGSVHKGFDTALAELAILAENNKRGYITTSYGLPLAYTHGEHTIHLVKE